jgi:V/A-type H+-transporting ATPase subunit I
MWELYGFVTGLMGDILSYLRLFALGLAGGLLGNAVNRIAFMMITDDAGIIHYSFAGTLGTIVILVLGHSLNMAIAALGGFVHSLRLTFVEFYKNLKFEGGSKAFEPFSLHK